MSPHDATDHEWERPIDVTPNLHRCDTDAVQPSAPARLRSAGTPSRRASGPAYLLGRPATFWTGRLSGR